MEEKNLNDVKKQEWATNTSLDTLKHSLKDDLIDEFRQLTILFRKNDQEEFPSVGK